MSEEKAKADTQAELSDDELAGVSGGWFTDPPRRPRPKADAELKGVNGGDWLNNYQKKII